MTAAATAAVTAAPYRGAAGPQSLTECGPVCGPQLAAVGRSHGMRRAEIGADDRPADPAARRRGDHPRRTAIGFGLPGHAGRDRPSTPRRPTGWRSAGVGVGATPRTRRGDVRRGTQRCANTATRGTLQQSARRFRRQCCRSRNPRNYPQDGAAARPRRTRCLPLRAGVVVPANRRAGTGSRTEGTRMTTPPDEEPTDYPDAWKSADVRSREARLDPLEAEMWLAALSPVELAQVLHRVRGDR